VRLNKVILALILFSAAASLFMILRAEPYSLQEAVFRTVLFSTVLAGYLIFIIKPGFFRRPAKQEKMTSDEIWFARIAGVLWVLLSIWWISHSWTVYYTWQ